MDKYTYKRHVEVYMEAAVGALSLSLSLLTETSQKSQIPLSSSGGKAKHLRSSPLHSSIWKGILPPETITNPSYPRLQHQVVSPPHVSTNE